MEMNDLELQEDPIAGSMLDKAGLKKGAVISKVNGKVVKSAQELKIRMRAAKEKNGKVTLKVRENSGGKFVEKSFSL